MIHILDITKEKCPMTFVKVKLKLAQLKRGERLNVLLSGGEPLNNVPRAVVEEGYNVIEISPEGSCYRVLIEK